MKKLILLLGLLILTSCADLNTTAFRLEKTTADLAAASVSSFNRYYEMATNGASATKIADLTKQRDQVWDASRKTSALLSVTELARLAYSTNATAANATILQTSLSLLTANSGSVTGLVGDAMAPYSTLELKGKP